MSDKSINFWGRADGPSDPEGPLECSAHGCCNHVHGMTKEDALLMDYFCDKCLIEGATDTGDWDEDALAAAERAGIDTLKLINA